jgi:hypothetical protein
MKTAFAKKSLTLSAALGGLSPTTKSPTVNVGKVMLPDGKAGIHLRGK